MITKREDRVKDYLVPIKVVETSENVVDAQNLLKRIEWQNVIARDEFCAIEGKGYIILDFGQEYYGGVRLMTNTFSPEPTDICIRFRFGESLTEVSSDVGYKGETNDHSTRDFSVFMSSNSDMQWGNTGYRYIRIDHLGEGTMRINNIYGTFIHREEPLSKFECNDDLLNNVYKAAQRTIFLNMQNYIWDGVKRDQHVWMGDLYPEILSVLCCYGNIPLIKESMDTEVTNYKLPCWYHGIPTYSVWFVLIQDMLAKRTGQRIDYYEQTAREILKQVNDNTNEDGEFVGNRDEIYYWEDLFDWPSFGSPDGIFGSYVLSYYTVKEVANSPWIDADTRKIVDELLAKYARHESFKPKFKAVAALGLFVGKCDKDWALDFLKKDGGHGYSAFLGYFIAKALADNGYTKEAFDSMEEFYGGMIKLGSSTIWENFDLDWMKNACRIDEYPKEGQKDIHGDFGANCYTGFRHSLCHGWSSGIIPFIHDYVLGFSYTDDKHNKIRLNPNLCGLEYINCDIPTDKGMMHIELKQENGKVIKKVKLPKGLKLVK